MNGSPPKIERPALVALPQSTVIGRSTRSFSVSSPAAVGSTVFFCIDVVICSTVVSRSVVLFFYSNWKYISAFC